MSPSTYILITSCTYEWTLKRTHRPLIREYLQKKKSYEECIYELKYHILDIFFWCEFVKSICIIVIVETSVLFRYLRVGNQRDRKGSRRNSNGGVENACEFTNLSDVAPNIFCRSILISYLAGFYIWSTI